MAKTTKPLTNTEVKQSKPRDKEYNLADGAGLALRVKPNGAKYWLFNYSRPYTKKRSNISFGTYPETSLASARRKREDARILLAKDIDPKEHRDLAVQKEQLAHNNTLKHIAEQWFEIKKQTIVEKHATKIWRSLEGHIFPSLGKVPIHKLTAPNTISTLKPLATKGHLDMVDRICQRLNEIMIYSVNTGLITANPLSGIKKAFKSAAKEKMPTLKPDELPFLMETISTANIKLTTLCLIQWQLHTMVRPSEAAGTCWKEIDLDNSLWNIPAERMKKKKAHTVPLTPQAIALLESMKPLSDHRKFVFPADRNPKNHTNAETANMALKRMGFKNKLVAHGMRALASTTLNEQGFDADIIEAALAHVDKNEVRSAYNRAEYLERRRMLMNWWSSHIEQASKGELKPSTYIKGLRVI